MHAWVRRVSCTQFDFVPDHDESSECLNHYPLDTKVYPFIVAPHQGYLSLYFFTTLSSLHLSTWQDHLNLPLLMQFLMLSRTKRSLNTEDGFLFFKVTLRIHLGLEKEDALNRARWRVGAGEIAVRVG